MNHHHAYFKRALVDGTSAAEEPFVSRFSGNSEENEHFHLSWPPSTASAGSLYLPPSSAQGSRIGEAPAQTAEPPSPPHPLTGGETLVRDP